MIHNRNFFFYLKQKICLNTSNVCLAALTAFDIGIKSLSIKVTDNYRSEREILFLELFRTLFELFRIF